MKKLNFNELNSIKTPDSWIQNAINIPNDKPIKQPLYLRPKVLATVASFVICVALSVTLFVLFQENTQAPVLPQKTTISNSDFFDETKQTYASIQSSVISSITTTQALVMTEPIESTKTTISTQLPSSDDTITPSQPVTEPTEVTQNTVIKPTVKPDNSHPISSTVEPTELTTVTKEPSDPMIAFPTEPTFETDFVPPSTETTLYFKSNIIFVAKQNTILDRNENLYCHLEKTDGTSCALMGSVAEMVLKKQDYENRYKAVYSPDKYLNIEQGEYKVTFYNKNGKSISRWYYLGDKDVEFYE